MYILILASINILKLTPSHKSSSLYLVNHCTGAPGAHILSLYESRFMIVGFCGSLGIASIYSKAKPQRNHYSVSSDCILEF